jgi:hypothetical protein
MYSSSSRWCTIHIYTAPDNPGIIKLPARSSPPRSSRVRGCGSRVMACNMHTTCINERLRLSSCKHAARYLGCQNAVTTIVSVQSRLRFRKAC